MKEAETEIEDKIASTDEGDEDYDLPAEAEISSESNRMLLGEKVTTVTLAELPGLHLEDRLNRYENGLSEMIQNNGAALLRGELTRDVKDHLNAAAKQGPEALAKALGTVNKFLAEKGVPYGIRPTVDGEYYMQKHMPPGGRDALADPDAAAEREITRLPDGALERRIPALGRVTEHVRLEEIRGGSVAETSAGEVFISTDLDTVAITAPDGSITKLESNGNMLVFPPDGGDPAVFKPENRVNLRDGGSYQLTYPNGTTILWQRPMNQATGFSLQMPDGSHISASDGRVHVATLQPVRPILPPIARTK